MFDLVGAVSTDAIEIVPCAGMFGPGMTTLGTVGQLSELTCFMASLPAPLQEPAHGQKDAPSALHGHAAIPAL